MVGINKTDEEIINILKYYVPTRWHDLNNWDIILSRAIELAPNLYFFKCSFLELFFDEEMNILEYGDVVIQGEKVYYNIYNVPNFENYKSGIFLNDLYDSSKTSILDREDLKNILRRYNAKNGV